MTQTPKEKLILQFLRKNGRSSTSKIGTEIKADIGMTKKYLENLEEKQKVSCEAETQGTYWEIKR